MGILKIYMEPVVTLLIVVISVITALLVVVGIHLVQLLRDVRQTVHKSNQTIDTINQMLGAIQSPFGKQKGGLVEGLKTGLNLAQAFSHWLTQNHIQDNQNHEPPTHTG